MRTAEDVLAIEKARKYLERCEDNMTAAMHCDDEGFKAAAQQLRRAQIILHNLEAK